MGMKYLHEILMVLASITGEFFVSVDELFN